MKKDALRQFGLPIQVRSGFVGKIKLQIPVRQIRSAPWLIVIEQLYLVAGPIRLSEVSKIQRNINFAYINSEIILYE